MADFETIGFEVSDHILTLALRRPDRLNALNRRMAEELIEALDRSDADPDVRAVIVTGEGRAFCAGFDLAAADAFDLGLESVDWAPLEPDHAIRDLGGLLTLRLYESLKPLIAAVNGPAVGIGATMLLPMDIRISTNDARFAFPFVQRGIVPDAASAWFLPRIVGMGAASDWMLSGRFVAADEALRDRLLRTVVEKEDLLDTARLIAGQIAAQVAPVSATLTRHMLWRGLGLDHPMDMHRIDSRLIAERGRHGDSREGVAGFLEKRPAAFPGRVPADLPRSFPWWTPRPFS